MFYGLDQPTGAFINISVYAYLSSTLRAAEMKGLLLKVLPRLQNKKFNLRETISIPN